jgi:hypothetical protein
MSTLFVAEYGGSVYPGDNRETIAPKYPSLAEYAIALSGASNKGAQIQNNTRLLVLTSDVACSFSLGPAASAAATATNRYLPANTPVEISVPAFCALAVAAITNS